MPYPPWPFNPHDFPWCHAAPAATPGSARRRCRRTRSPTPRPSRPVARADAGSGRWSCGLEAMEFGDFPWKNGDFPRKNGEFSRTNDDFPRKILIFRGKMGSFHGCSIILFCWVERKVFTMIVLALLDTSGFSSSFERYYLYLSVILIYFQASSPRSGVLSHLSHP